MKAPPHFDAADFSSPLRRGTTVLEASAGTGKTYALCALYLRLILEHDLGVQQILVTTFTKAATAELRGRIRALLRQAYDALGAGASEDDFLKAVVERWRDEAPKICERLLQCLRDFDEAAIFTIDGFCLRMLSDRAFESGSLLDLELLPDSRELAREVAADYWRRRFYGTDDCLSSAACVAKLSVQRLADALNERQLQATAKIRPEFLPSHCDVLCQKLSAAFAALRRCWKTDEAAVRHQFSETQNSWAKGKHAKAAEVSARLDSLAEFLDGTCGSAEGHEAIAFFTSSAVARDTRVRAVPPKLAFFAECETFQNLHEEFDTAVLLDFLQWAPVRLAELKTHRRAQSYGDLLSRMDESVAGPKGDAMVRSIRSRFRAALIDEFQDTDPLQDRIFERLFGDDETWLFLIGDPKQAIYSFRGADVFTYLKAAQRAGNQRYTLGTNFRSSQKLVAATNYLFSQSQRAFVLDEIAFEPVASGGHREDELFSGDATSAPFRVWRWEGDSAARIDAVRQELTLATAAEISRVLKNGWLGERRVVPADIAVLTATNDEARKMQAALAASGIPAVLLQTDTVFRSREAKEMFCILSAIARPANESLLRAALLTEIFGESFAAVDALSADEAAWESWIERFQAWHSAWIGRGLTTMFQRFIREAALAPRLLQHVDGDRRLTNILHLAEVLQKVALEGQLGPRGVVKWLGRQLCEPAADVDEYEVRLERDEDAVRIVTVHKSKGLEYNIVFCPLLVRSAETRGRPLHYHDPESADLVLDFGTSSDPAVAALAATEALADEVRKLYVALTRARQRCDLVWGYFGDATTSAVGWLFHPPPASTPATPAALEKHISPKPNEQRWAEVEALAKASRGAIALYPMPSTEAAPHRPAGSSTPALAARKFRGTIPRDYCVSSFSSLTAVHNAELPDYDAPRPESDAPETLEPPEGIHALPGGTRTGICMHEIFEELDFTDSTAVDPLVRSKLAAFAFPPVVWAESVTACVHRVLQVPLADGFRLSELPSGCRLAELEFFLPAARLDAAPLRQMLAEDGLDQLDFAPRQGWLKGFIDLVAEHRGRFYLFDWKTNRLGDRSTAYSARALGTAMSAHRYGLQLHLYALALHRYLRHRIPDYDYERHFGGAYYLFIRGVDPKRPELGVVRRRPELKTITSLERWLEGKAATSSQTPDRLAPRQNKRSP